jgi:hypothetical protein
MDNFEETKADLQEEEEVDALWISEDIRSYIYDTAKWTKFLSVVGFVFSAMIALSAFGTAAFLSTLAKVSPGNPMVQIGSTVLTVVYLLIALLQFYPSFLLFKFSTSATQAVLYADQPSLAVAMAKMKSFFKFWGVITIVFISFYILMMITVILGVAGGAA